MKKLVLLFAAATLAVSASAQTVAESKTFDNIYVGINGGVATKITGQSGWLNGLNPNAGIRIGRYFTPVFGLAVEGNAYFSNKPGQSVGTTVRYSDVSLLGTVNLSNWFGGYKGEPRAFEVSAIAGLGWGHVYGHKMNVDVDYPVVNAVAGQEAYDVQTLPNNLNDLTAKTGLNFAFNLGSKKAWQVYVEPAVLWGLHTFRDRVGADWYDGIHNPGCTQFNINKAYFQANAGIVYKFKNSNGTHNFQIVVPRDQAEIDGLNARINALQAELAKKPKEVIKEVVKEVPVGKEVKVENLVFVTFAQGKSILTKEAKAALDNVKSDAHVQVVGTASPEGSKELNDRLSQARANAVADYLKGRGVTVDEAIGKGVQGTTSNRLAIVYVK